MAAAAERRVAGMCDLPGSVARGGNRVAALGVGCRHNVHSGVAGFSALGSGDGLGEPTPVAVVAVERPGCGFLHGGAGHGPEPTAGVPEICHTAQGSPFTSEALTGQVRARGTRMSRDS